MLDNFPFERSSNLWRNIFPLFSESEQKVMTVAIWKNILICPPLFIEQLQKTHETSPITPIYYTAWSTVTFS